MIPKEVLERIQAVASVGTRVNVDLAAMSRWRIGGRAAVLVEPSSVEQIQVLAEIIGLTDVPMCVIGDTSNILFDSAGYSGVIVRIGSMLSRAEISNTSVVVEAGMSMLKLTELLANAGLSGLEHATGIPGTVGGLVTMNGGSQRKGIGSSVAWVQCVDSAGNLKTFTQQECEFEYRTSVFQGSELIVVQVGLRLEYGDRQVLLAERERILESRRDRFPSNLPNCGSTFLSDPAMYSIVGPPGKAIEAAGLKGLRIGGAQVSPMHANFIVNTGDATSQDVLDLIDEVRTRVHALTGYFMDCEVRYVSASGDIVPAHRVRDVETTTRAAKYEAGIDPAAHAGNDAFS